MTVSKPGQQPIVYINGRQAPQLHVVSVEHSMGGKRLDQATLAVDFGVTGDTLRGRQIADNFRGQACEITVQTPVGERVIHWGKISKDSLQVSDEIGETLVSTTEPYHFGDPVRGFILFGNGSDDKYLFQVDEPLIFNPMVDGRLRPNMYPWPFSDFNNTNVFIDPTQSETPIAADFHCQGFEHEDGIGPRLWTLARAVNYLWTVLNPEREGGRYIRPIPLAALENIFVRNGRPIYLQNAAISDGMFLPDALDKLLTPYGFSWSVLYLARGARYFQPHKMGAGFQNYIQFQDRGDYAQQELSHAKGFELTADNARRLNNTYLARGSRKLTEITVELYPAWSWAESVTPEFEQLSLGSDFLKNTPEYVRWYRDYVLNEAGDYIGNRVPRTVENSNPKQTEFFILRYPFRWSTIFPAPTDRDEDVDEETAPVPVIYNKLAPRRRRFLPCISLERYGGGPAFSDTKGVLVEWSPDAGETWYSIDGNKYYDLTNGDNPAGEDVGIEILKKECGIRFTGTQPPSALFEAGSDGRVRITATIEHDVAITGWLTDPNTYNPDRVPILIDVADRFHWREVHEDAVTVDGLPDDDEDPNTSTSALFPGTADDREAIALFVANLNEAWNAIDVTGEIPLEGLEWSWYYNVGDLILGVTGRVVDLQTSTRIRYPQVVGVRYDVRNQQMLLALDTWRDESPA